MTTATIYSDADDGYITGADATWAAARSTSTASDVGGSTFRAGYEVTGAGGSYSIHRAFLRFDTSSLAGATLTSATLKVKISAIRNDSDYAARVYRYAWASTLSGNREADYDGAYGGSATYEGDLFDTTISVPVGGDVLSLAVSTGGINTSGYTSYTIVSDQDVLNIDPGGDSLSYADFYAADNTGTASDPYLEIVYTPAATNSLPSMRMLLGVG